MSGPAPIPASGEVRRCDHCGQIAVTLVSDWKQTVWSMSTGGSASRDYRCQSCGAAFTIYPKSSLFVLGTVGLATLFTCVGPLVCGFLLWRRSTADARNPVVPGAPMPPIRWRAGPDARRCGGCGGLAHAAKIVRHSSNGVPTGTEYTFRCVQCSRVFTVDSLWGHVFAFLMSGLIAFVVAAFLIWGSTPGWRWGGASVSALILLVIGGQAVNRVVNRIRNPEVAEPTAFPSGA